MIDKNNVYFNRLQYIKKKKKYNNKILHQDHNNIHAVIEIDKKKMSSNLIRNIKEYIQLK